VFLTPEAGNLRGFFYSAVLRWKKQQKQVKKRKIFQKRCKPVTARLSGVFKSVLR